MATAPIAWLARDKIAFTYSRIRECELSCFRRRMEMLANQPWKHHRQPRQSANLGLIMQETSKQRGVVNHRFLSECKLW